MKISVALCTFNGERFVRTQLESLADQTRTPDQLMISDDASTDRTVSIIEDFARSCTFPVSLVVNATTLGLVKNFDQTIARCDGDIIFLCDQDDFWYREKIEQVSAAFSNDRIGIVFSDADIVDESLNPLSKRLTSAPFRAKVKDRNNFNLFEGILNGNVVAGMTMAFRSGLREVAQPIPSDLPGIIHDGWISLVAALSGEWLFLDQSLVMYRQHPHQLVGEDNSHPEILGTSRREQIARYSENSLYQIDRLERIRNRLEKQVFHKLGQKSVGDARDILEKQINFWGKQKSHLQWRSNLSPNRLKRLPGIFTELVRGKYSRFSNGAKSAFKDLFLP